MRAIALLCLVLAGCGQVSYDGFSSATVFKDVAVGKAILWKTLPDGTQVYVEIEGTSNTNAAAIQAAVEAGIAAGRRLRP
jgi:hypothetical protein